MARYRSDLTNCSAGCRTALIGILSVAVIATSIVPPWHTTFRNAGLDCGYSPLWSAPQSGWLGCSIDFARLLLEWVVLFAVGALFWLARWWLLWTMLPQPEEADTSAAAPHQQPVACKPELQADTCWQALEAPAEVDDPGYWTNALAEAQLTRSRERDDDLPPVPHRFAGSRILPMTPERRRDVLQSWSNMRRAMNDPDMPEHVKALARKAYHKSEVLLGLDGAAKRALARASSDKPVDGPEG
jgi:hypothetical protein